MSAYGAIPAQNSPALPATHWALSAKPGTQADTTAPATSTESLSLAVYHLTAATAPSALAAHLHTEFEAELQRGTTYPQESPIARASFDAYFLGNDVFVGILQSTAGRQLSLESARAGRDWQECVGGAYYVKPNYPGRSSHICNAGFLVPPRLRGLGIATALARSYVHNAPRLGYKASVFNLVYVNNMASVRIWDRLGFEKIGRIPRAGRLKRRPEDGDGEEYIDAWVVWKSFEGDEGALAMAP